MNEMERNSHDSKGVGERDQVLADLLRLNDLSFEMAEKAGCELSRSNDVISLRKGHREVRISTRNVVYLYDLIPFFDLYFSQVVPSVEHSFDVVDFSTPKVHRLNDCDLEFKFTSLAEGPIAFISYNYGLPVNEGDIVLDAGAYCGVSTYFYSKAVGPRGKVIALEPDPLNYKCFLENIERHNLRNVIPIQAALWEETTTLRFIGEGSLGSGTADHVRRPEQNPVTEVAAMSFTDVLKEAGVKKFDYVKMDIEGAEIEALERLSSWPLRKISKKFAIASYHLVKGEQTRHFLESFFEKRSFSVKTDAPFGRPCHGGLVTWAEAKPTYEFIIARLAVRLSIYLRKMFSRSN